MQLGEISVHQPRNFIPGETSTSILSLFKQTSLNVSNVVWSSPNTICFTVKNISMLPGVSKLNYYVSMEEQPNWINIGKSLTSGEEGIHSFRVMHLKIPTNVKMVVIGALPHLLNENHATHRGPDFIHLALEEGPKAILSIN